MKNLKRFLTTFIVTFLVVCFVGMAEVENNPVAEAMVSSSEISWIPKVNYTKLILNISRPNGTIFSKTFDKGAAPYVNLSDLLDTQYIDGSYTYELRAVSFTRNKVRRDDGFSALSKETRAPEALTQTGYFSVRGGMIVTPGAVESGDVLGISSGQEGLSRTQDQVILDDLIVDGSLCVGMDCVNGESFGFDTIRLKENNLRIKFQDTSSTSSFPSRDWQITINDSANGGGNYFAIDDIDGGRTPFTIEASAPSNSLYVDDGGRVGFGTSTPVVDLHVKTGNTPTLRLEQDGSSGFTPQTWDVAGNEANFFIRDATNGSTLPLRIIPGAPSNSIFINSDGKVGIGTSSPDAELHMKDTSDGAQIHVESKGPAKLVLNNTDDDKWAFNASANGLRINANDSSTIFFRLTNTGDLIIEGDITANGACCADYVFEPNYSLMPLTKLSEFIKKEKHLPNIPTAAEMNENGVNMSELQIKLLEKVEELTLYTLSQQETINELKKEIAALKKK